MTDPRQFYSERVPQQFNAALKEQQALGNEGRRVLDDMRAVDATIRVEVAGECFFLNIAQGQMTPGDSPDHPPFLTLVQDRAAFERLAAEAGDSAMALLGGLSGLADYKLDVPAVPALLSPLVTSIPLQLLAYHIAVMRGCNVDRPRNLAKSVTVE